MSRAAWLWTCWCRDTGRVKGQPYVGDTTGNGGRSFFTATPQPDPWRRSWRPELRYPSPLASPDRSFHVCQTHRVLWALPSTMNL